MLPQSLRSLLLLISLPLASSTTRICSPSTCITLDSSPSQPFTLGASIANTSIYLLPGRYAAESLPWATAPNSSILASSSQYHLSPSLTGLAPVNDGFALVFEALDHFDVVPAQGLNVFRQPEWTDSEASPVVGSAWKDTAKEARSALLGPNVWARIEIGGVQRVLWEGGGRDLGARPLRWEMKDQSVVIRVLDVQSSSCLVPCSIGGTCVASSAAGTNGTCTCLEGFEGKACERCKSGFFGPSCQPCASKCSSGACDDGIAGTGFCVASTVNSTEACNCFSGVCTSTRASPSFLFNNATCACSTGWTSLPLTSAQFVFSHAYQQCSICLPGYYGTNEKECRTCSGEGVKECTAEATPTACVDGYELESGKCVASEGPSGKGSRCSGSNWWNAKNAACEPCSPLCSSCYGSTASTCLSCRSGKALLAGSCVDVNSVTGQCDASTVVSLSTNSGWYFDNEKAACDTCPAKSVGCKINSFNSSSTRADIVATACVDGYVLSLEGACVPECPRGQFISPTLDACLACDSSCGTCAGSPSFCTACPASSSNVASLGSCTASSCPDSTVNVNGTCRDCHPDCKTCSGLTFDSCISCTADRPVLSDGRCLPVCASTEFFDIASSSCVPCDATCSTCIGRDPTQCLSCSAPNSLPQRGICLLATCNTTTTDDFLPSLQICLSDLLVPFLASHNGRRSLPSYSIVLIVLLVLLLLAAVAFIGWWFIRRERRRTKEATARFADGLDAADVRKRVSALAASRGGVEGLLGLMARARDGMERRWRGRGEVGDVAGEGKVELKRLWLGSRGREKSHQQRSLSGRKVDGDDDFEIVALSEIAEEERRRRRGILPSYWSSASLSTTTTSSPSTRSRPKFTIGSDSDEEEDDGKGRTRLLALTATNTPPPPSPPYTEFDHQSSLIYPYLPSPPPSVPRPSLFKPTLASSPLVPTNTTPAAADLIHFTSPLSFSEEAISDHKIDTTLRSLPSVQASYTASRDNPHARVVSIQSPPRQHVQLRCPRTWYEGVLDANADNSDGDGNGEQPTTPETPHALRRSYWLARQGVEGGRAELEISFAGADAVTLMESEGSGGGQTSWAQSSAGTTAGVVGMNNPFRARMRSDGGVEQQQQLSAFAY